MDADFLMELDEILQNGEFETAIEKIRELDEDEMTVDLYITLAHSLSQCSRFREALDALRYVSDETEEDDFAYHLELAGAYYGLHHYRSALREARECLRIDENLVDPWILIALIYQETGQDELFENASATAKELDEEAWNNVFGDRLDELEAYNNEDLHIITRHIERYFGQNGELFPIFNENGEVFPHPISVILIPPDAQKDFYKLVTIGIGAYRGIETDDLGNEHIHRVELCAFLSGELTKSQVIGEYQWTARIMRQFGEMIETEGTFLGYGHTVSYGEVFDGGVGFNGVIFDNIEYDDDFSDVCTLSDKEQVRFLQIMPLYEEEMLYKIENGHSAIFNKLRSMYYHDYFKDDFDSILREPSFLTGVDIIDINRKNTCEDAKSKKCLLPRTGIEKILDWDGPDGCFATDRITVDGCMVGYMYREEPVKDQPDSGWRFLGGDEDENYMNDLTKMDIYSLNTIANYDVDIIEYLESPFGSAFYRDKNGNFIPA